MLTSAYRLQLHAGFPLAEARRRLAYLRELGIDAVYLSPCCQAAPGSAHGYDVTDYNRINPELGGAEAFDGFCAETSRLGLRVLLDWVPNHMGLADNNALWTDVLENGQASAYARFFDIDWAPAKPELRGKVLLPVLGDLYGRVLEDGGLRLAFSQGAFWIEGAGRRLPVAPETYPRVLQLAVEELGLPAGDRDRDELLSVTTAFARLPGAERPAEREREKEIAKRRLAELAGRSDAVRRFVESRVARFNAREGVDLLDELLGRQHYRVAHWKVASEEINYRRFFNINELAAVRMEDEAVFRHCHRLALQLVRERKIHGLRIDHIDGLYDPAGYLERLQAACAAALDPSLPPDQDPAHTTRTLAPGEKPLYVVVEKILARHEAIPADWRAHGTVGYDYLNALGGLFVDPAREKEVDASYESFTGQRADFDRLVYATKKLFAAEYMASEIHALGHRVDAVSESSRYYRDYTRYHLTLAMREIVDCFPVYRTYIAPKDAAAGERDAQYIRIAVEKARRRAPAIDPGLFDFLQDLLLLRLAPPRVSEAALPLYRDLVLRFQQLTGPIMAKGLEDTAFYANSRLLSLNEVGGDPDHFGVSPEDFHKQNSERASAWPSGLLATSTHDTKRSEDARARISAISELPSEWKAATARWTLANAKRKTEVDGRPEPSGEGEYAIYQTLAAMWPEEPIDEAGRASLLERVWEYSLKAAREAKRRTNWVSPNAAYEQALRRFLEGLLDAGPENHFLVDFLPLQARLAELGRLNSLSALTLKLGSPGVVDVYQGCESWNLRVVDPDNRRPVDFDRTERSFAEVRALPPETAARDLFGCRADGRIKMLLLHRGLQLRRRHPELFVGGEYAGLKTEGTLARNAIALSRKADGLVAIAAAGRFFNDLMSQGSGPVGAAWKDTMLALPPAMRGWGFRDAYTGRIVAAVPTEGGAALPLAEVFAILPCALLTAQA